MCARLLLLLIGAMALVACGSDASPDSPASSSTTLATVGQPGDTTNPVPDASPTTTAAPPDFTRFIAAVDLALADTSYAGTALSDPEVFVATGQLFCELLDEGMTLDEILVEHLDALASVKGGDLTSADATATGVVLGASTEVICPQHAG